MLQPCHPADIKKAAVLTSDSAASNVYSEGHTYRTEVLMTEVSDLIPASEAQEAESGNRFHACLQATS